MIIISLSQDLEDNPNLVIIDCIKSFGHFFFVSQLGKCQHRSKPLIICPKPSNMVNHLTCGKKFHGYVEVREHPIACLKEEILLSLNLTPVTNTPWKHCNLTSCVTQSQSHLCQHQSDLFIILFLRKLCAICICLLQFAFCVCTKKSRLGRSCLKFVTQLFLHGPSIIITCITWVMQFIIFKHVV
jgi:hypothetical protein